MCGIAGFIDFSDKSSASILERMNQQLTHRGPDGCDQTFVQVQDAQVGLAHRRLSIIDLTTAASQPMRYAHYQIIFNGEIYNYAELREELICLGHRFQAHSDTEVILHAYQQWGNKMVDRFIGMFAFALYDEEKREVLIYRDRTGIKPLYYYWHGGTFLFGSELKALTAHPSFEKRIDDTALSLYFKYAYIKAPYTIYQHCYKLLPGHCLKFSLSKKEFGIEKYWDVKDFYNAATSAVSEQEAEEKAEALFQSAFQYRMVADVPVGVFLSGGYDSSLVTAMLQKNSTQQIKTFTIGFEEDGFNEAHHARKVAAYLGTQHNEYLCTTKEAEDIIPSLPYFYDEPFGDSSAIPTVLVSRFARQQVTVALSADGGDEIFAGYNRYDQITKLRAWQKRLPLPLRQLSSLVIAKTFQDQLPFARKYTFRMNKLAELMTTSSVAEMSDYLFRHFTKEETKALLPFYKNGETRLISEDMINGHPDFINSLLMADYKTYLVDDILVKVDRASMSASLEGREPLLDHRIVEWAASLPSDLKYRNGQKKYLLKKIAWKYLPADMMERPKAGFRIPVNQWMRQDLKELVLNVVNEDALRKHGLLDRQTVLKVRDHHLKGYKDDQQLWLLLMFQLWWNQWHG